MVISLKQLPIIFFVTVYYFCWTNRAVSDTVQRNELLDSKFTMVPFQTIPKTLPSTTVETYKYVNVSKIVNNKNLLNELVGLS